MTEAVFDFAAIGKIANLKALEGRPQDDVTAGIPRTEPVVQEPHDCFYGYALPVGSCGSATIAQADLPAVTASDYSHMMTQEDEYLVFVNPDGAVFVTDCIDLSTDGAGLG